MIEIFYAFIAFVFIVSGISGLFTFISDSEERIEIYRRRRDFPTLFGRSTVETDRKELFEDTIGKLLNRPNEWTTSDGLYGNDRWQFARTAITCSKDPKDIEMTSMERRVWLSYEEKRILFYYFDIMRQIQMGNYTVGPNTIKRKEEVAYETISRT